MIHCLKVLLTLDSYIFHINVWNYYKPWKGINCNGKPTSVNALNAMAPHRFLWNHLSFEDFFDLCKGLRWDSHVGVFNRPTTICMFIYWVFGETIICIFWIFRAISLICHSSSYNSCFSIYYLQNQYGDNDGSFSAFINVNQVWN